MDTSDDEVNRIAAAVRDATLNDGNNGIGNLTRDHLLEEELIKANEMKIGELKLKLQAMGVLINGFCEKSEFTRAYAEAVVNEKLSGNGGDDDDDEDDDDENPMLNLPTSVVHRVDKLKELHMERENLMAEYMKQRAALESKYQALFKPLYDKRAAIVNGDLDDEATKQHSDAMEDEDEEKVVGIPQFWVCAFTHMDTIALLITESDLPCLEYLQDVTCTDDDNGQGFTLEFHFAPNPYFTNKVLTKRYDVPNLLTTDEPILKNVQGCEIDWKPNHCLTYKEVIKAQRGKGKNAGQVRNVKSKQRTESFFQFFEPPKLPTFDKMNEQEAERLEQAFDQDYDVAQAFRTHIIPKAVVWFTNQAIEQEMEDAMKGMDTSGWPAE